MKFLLCLTLSLISMTTFAQTVTWPEGLPCVKVGGFAADTGRYEEGVTKYEWFGRTFKETEGYIAEITGRPPEQIKLSFNYLQYRFGYHIMAQAEYAADCNSFPSDSDPEMQEIRKKSNAGTLKAEDFKGPRWLHVIQAIDKAEVNCLAISKINGKLQGCNDIWLDGLQEDELVCIKGKTYPKCHIECLEKIYSRKVEQTSGTCKEEAK
ncbi:MAG: hypothetical protein V4598_17415 [Bdellovibrionota bacterium]